jgi:Arc/MetJ-type ribon-helix-helix transcriptional regulator
MTCYTALRRSSPNRIPSLISSCRMVPKISINSGARLSQSVLMSSMAARRVLLRSTEYDESIAAQQSHICRFGKISPLPGRWSRGEATVVMSRTTSTFPISLPPEMATEVERVRKEEHCTRSELVREALRRVSFLSDRQAAASNGLPLWRDHIPSASLPERQRAHDHAACMVS